MGRGKGRGEEGEKRKGRRGRRREGRKKGESEKIGKGRKGANQPISLVVNTYNCSTRCTLSVCVSHLHGWGVHEVEGKEVVDTHSLQ